MEGDASPEFKKQIRKSLPRRSLSFDRETAHNSTSIPAVLSSSPSSSHINPLPSPRRDSRPSSPERKANFRMSKELTTVQESPGTQANEETDKEQHSCSGGEAAASGGTAQTDHGHTSSTENVKGLNILSDEASHPRPREEQQMRTSGIENTQQIAVVDNAAAEAPSTGRGLDPGFDDHASSDKSSPSKSANATGAEKLSQSGHAGESQPTLDATTAPEADGVSQPRNPTQGSTESEHHKSSTGVDAVKHLEVPLDGGEGRPSSESPTLFQNPSDTGQEAAQDRRTRNSSQTGSQGREKMAKHTDAAGSVIEDGRAGGGWFKSILKKIPCFN